MAVIHHGGIYALGVLPKFETAGRRILQCLSVTRVATLITFRYECRSIMVTRETFQGVPGILRPFKEFVEAKGFKKGDQIVYYGVPGTCMPFIELLAFSLRSLELDQVFVPMTDERKAHRIRDVPDIGMQARVASVTLNPRVVVVMGGLSMPNIPVKAEEVKAVIDRHPGAVVIGVCFMHMFGKAGWLDVLSFDCLIDANIDPVEVTKK